MLQILKWKITLVHVNWKCSFKRNPCSSNKPKGDIFQFSGRIEAYFVFSRSHPIIDFFKLAIVGAQKLQGLWYWGHGGGWGADLSTQLLQRLPIQSSVLLLSRFRRVIFRKTLTLWQIEVKRVYNLHPASPPSSPGPLVAVCLPLTKKKEKKKELSILLFHRAKKEFSGFFILVVEKHLLLF